MPRIHPAPPLSVLIKHLPQDGPQSLQNILPDAAPVDAKGRYLPWHRLQYREPPDGQTIRSWWVATRLSRLAGSRRLPLLDGKQQPFRLTRTDQLLDKVERFHHAAIEIDQRIRDAALVAESQLFDESIASSQLEGSGTSTPTAHAMLVAGRKPRNLDERMIANNLKAMEFAAARAQNDVPLRPIDILDLHRTVAEGVLHDPKDAGRLQEPDEIRVAVYARSQIVHEPPPADQLPERIQRLCDFANADDGLQPIIRAILLHFMVGYDHPFVDGNGRTARSLFYWYMIHSGYEAVKHLSISRILQEAPAKYSRSYEFVTADDGDVTYFVDHQLDMMLRSVERFEERQATASRRRQRIRERVTPTHDLTERQIASLVELSRSTDGRITVDGHARVHNIALPTARADLMELVERGLLIRERSGRRFVFRPAPDLQERLGRAHR